jgi:hypothetical protein
MNHSEQIEAHVRMEAAQDLHDDLDRIRQMPSVRYAELYGRAHALLWLLAQENNSLEPSDALRQIDAEKARLFPENQDFEPHRYYGEGRNE